MASKKRVIILTDGDQTAYRALSEACDELQCHPLRASEGNPTPLTGQDLITAIQEAPQEPVVVMVDDRGDAGLGRGERALDALISSPDLDVLGVVAVAANTHPVRGVPVDVAVDQEGHVVEHAVDKDGHPTAGDVLKGDTVDVLKSYDGFIVGLGDPGKMEGHDAVGHGVPATRRAIEEILRNEVHRHGGR
ncbi:MAG: stage V sporulation protein AE [Firmicutes bacterium]|nr:stage V sporulation protein AE [Bacillota bacterium]